MILKKTTNKNPRQIKGFSLIEIIIAAALLSLMGMVLLTSITSSIDVKEEVEFLSNRFFASRQAITRMSREISMAYLSDNKNPQETVVETQFKGDKNKLSFVAFGHNVRSLNAKQSDQREITYSIGKDERTGEMALLRKQKINPGAHTGRDGITQTLCRNVKSLTFSYWDNDKGQWEAKWDTESITFKGKLPTRVKISFIVELDNNEEQKLETQTEIWITKPISFNS